MAFYWFYTYIFIVSIYSWLTRVKSFSKPQLVQLGFELSLSNPECLKSNNKPKHHNPVLMTSRMKSMKPIKKLNIAQSVLEKYSVFEELLLSCQLILTCDMLWRIRKWVFTVMAEPSLKQTVSRFAEDEKVRSALFVSQIHR